MINHTFPRMLCALVAFLAMMSTATQVAAQEWPNRPVRIIVTSPPSSPPDVIARGLAQQLAGRLGQPFVVENRPGASTIIGTQACTAAKPDGYTLCVTLNDTVSINPHLFNRLPYDPEKGLAPVAILGWPNSAIVINADVGPKTFREVVDASKAKPNTLNYGSFGLGSTAHLYLEWIRSTTGWDVTHIPFPGGALQATLAGQVQLTYLSIGALRPYIESGRLIPIAVAGHERSHYLPNVPTFSELGLGEFFVRTWFGLFAPAGMPAAIIDALNGHTVEIVNDPDFRAKVLDPITITPGKLTPAEMAAYIVKDREVGAKLVRASNVKLEF